MKECSTVSKEVGKKVEKCAEGGEVNKLVDVVRRGRVSLEQRIETMREKCRCTDEGWM